MCGIVGYVGKQSAAPIILEGLRRLEYRGYDSAGVAIIDTTDLLIRKKKGKINEGLARTLLQDPAEGCMGIGHTRWATHGPPADENSHPHLDQSGRIAPEESKPNSGVADSKSRANFDAQSVNVVMQIENGRVLKASIAGHKAGMDNYEALALRIARQRRYPSKATGQETVRITVTQPN